MVKEKVVLGEHTILSGDSLQLMRAIPENGIDCVITDPPYLGFGFTQENYCAFMRPFASEMLRCTQATSRVAISQPEFRLAELAVMFNAKSMIEIPDAYEDRRGEKTFFLLKNPLRSENVGSESWLGFANTSHPNPRDINKMAVLVKMMSDPDDTILDHILWVGLDRSRRCHAGS